MPILQMQIHFGGLCMFVQREDAPAGLFVLMPDMSSYHHKHCAVMVAESDYTQTGSAMMYPLFGKEIDFRLYAQGSTTAQAFDWTLNASDYTKEPVDPSFLNDAPGKCLACRIDLPFGVTVKPYGPSGLIDVTDVDGNSHEITVYGRSYLELEFDDKTLDSISLGDATLFPDGNGSIRVYFLNIELCDLNRVKPRKSHKAGEIADHPQSYYWLLNGHCPSHKGGPKFVIAEDVIGDGSTCPPSSCPKKPTAIEFDPPPMVLHFAPDPGLPWVDTHDCSQGSGTPS